MKIRAAVAREKGGPLSIEEIEIDEPRPDEIRVKVTATGVCHTDIVVRDGMVPTPLPVVLGHEGAGIVEKVGGAVTKVKPGDHVVMTFDSCGACPSCREHARTYCHDFFPRNFFAARPDGSTALRKNGEVIHSNFFGQSSFATHAMCYEANIVKVPSDIPLELLGPLACGVQTGAGSVMNALKVSAGKSFAVFGAGSVGLSALMAAKVVGATTIIAVDLNEERLKTARELGATHTINPSHAQPAEAILKITGHGVNYSLDSTGLPGVIRSAVESLAPRGACGILGASGPDAEIVLNETHLMSAGRKLFGIVEGESNTDVFIPILIDLHRQGLFPFDRLVKFYNFADINQAIQDSENGTAIDAGPYENGNTDFSAQIAILRKAGVEIFNTFPLPPDLPVFWRQAAQKGLAQKVKIVQLAKAGLFEAEMEALGELGYNMASGAYWHRAFPFTSPVTGMKCDAMSDGFEAATGKPWSQQVGAQMALIDAAIAALKASNAPKNREAVAKAISTLKTETSTGLVDFTAGPVPNCAVTGLVGTQWVKSPKGAKFPFSLEVTSNVLIPAVPITATLKPYKLG